MKTIKLLCLVLALSGNAMAQDFSKVCKEQMNVLSFFAGKWKGDATIVQQGGITIQVAQEEVIEFKLDSLVLQMEGTGRRKDNLTKISFHALAHINFNATKKIYEMNHSSWMGNKRKHFLKL